MHVQGEDVLLPRLINKKIEGGGCPFFHNRFSFTKGNGRLLQAAQEEGQGQGKEGSQWRAFHKACKD
jgi:hypothetical protein